MWQIRGDLTQAIAAACAAFAKHGTANVAYVHPSRFSDALHLDGVAIRARAETQPGEVWVGWEQGG